MKTRAWIGLGVLLLVGLWWAGRRGEPVKGNERRPAAREAAVAGTPVAGGAAPVKMGAAPGPVLRGPRPTAGGLELGRVEADGREWVEQVNYYGDGWGGFVAVREREELRVRLAWPYADQQVTVTRMDGGRFVSGEGNRINVPVNERGEVEFGFQIGAEAGRYQLELMGRSGGVEAFGFWAGEPTGETMPASGLEFVDPPLRKKK